VKRYEGLFILNGSITKEDTIKEVIEKITQEIIAVGGRVETIQKMDKRPFARVANKKHTSGYYVNFVFECQPTVLANLRNKFAFDEQIFRIIFTCASKKSLAVANEEKQKQ
jgi:ribosomal protein S6